MQRSAIRDFSILSEIPDCATLHPGYGHAQNTRPNQATLLTRRPQIGSIPAFHKGFSPMRHLFPDSSVGRATDC